MQEILSGHIPRSEENFQKAALEKKEKGQKSAYYDLCRMKDRYPSDLDVACVGFSSGLIVYFIVWISFPITVKIVNMIR
ncbi:MAG: hypothetical protein WC552_00765 [Candidatus Omnitrophota bacterium]